MEETGHYSAYIPAIILATKPTKFHMERLVEICCQHAGTTAGSFIIAKNNSSELFA